MLGSQRRLVRRWEWLRLMPNDGFFPQSSHTAAINHTLSEAVLTGTGIGGTRAAANGSKVSITEHD